VTTKLLLKGAALGALIVGFVATGCVIEEYEGEDHGDPPIVGVGGTDPGYGGTDPGYGGTGPGYGGGPSSTSTSSSGKDPSSSTSSSGTSTSSSGTSSSSSSSTSSGTGGSAPTANSPGDACTCDADCPADSGHPGVCVYGVCMTVASGQCSSSGSTAECGTGSRCWGLNGQSGYICWPDCASYPSCAGSCDQDGSCVFDQNTSCHVSCGTYCDCQPGDCPQGESCVSGSCVPDNNGSGPGQGPGPTCPNLPQRDCTSGATYCSQLVVFNPRVTPHYDDYPINGETANNQYRSYLRRDLSMLLDYATAKTLCKSAGWNTGNGGALGFGDMSEVNGAIPGTSINQPGHPPGTHVDGFDIDVGYYQTNTSDNYLRPVCAYGDYHCTAPPHLLDTWRTALFLGILFESNRTRVIGVDGQVGLVVDPAITQLCSTGWLSSAACSNNRLTYEVTNQNYGWFQFHHHHAHLSLCPGSAPCSNVNVAPTGPMLCKSPGCAGIGVKPGRKSWFPPSL